MHTVELLEEALDKAREVGFEVRQDWLGGDGGGHCLVRGRKWLLLDLAQPQADQLEVVADALRASSNVVELNLSPELAQRIEVIHTA